MTIIRNSAKCNACGVEVISTHRHDFRGHTCDAGTFYVDGGKEYLRRVGDPLLYTDTSIYEEDKKEKDNSAKEQDRDTYKTLYAKRPSRRHKEKRPKVAG